MFLIDDILMAPIHGIVWIFEKVRNAALEEQESDKEAINAELRNLYMLVETQKISEEEFDAREKELLDRLDQIEGSEDSEEEEQDDDQEE